MSDIRKALEEILAADKWLSESTLVEGETNAADRWEKAVAQARAALAQPQAAQPAPVVWIDPADLAELQTKENRDHAHNWTLTAKQIGRCTSPLYATPPTEPAPLRHSTTWSGDCPHWCKACAAERPAPQEKP